MNTTVGATVLGRCPLPYHNGRVRGRAVCPIQSYPCSSRRQIVSSGRRDGQLEVYERNRIAGVLRIFDHSAKQWEADHDISKSGNEKPLGVRTGGFVSGEKVIRWARRHGLREIQHSKKVNANRL